MGSVEEILAGYEALRPGQEAFYQELHRHPASPAPSPSGIDSEAGADVARAGERGVISAPSKATGSTSDHRS